MNKEIIIGEINGNDMYLYWEIDKSHNARVGDYAIVEFMKGYSLAKIIGLATVGDDFKYDLKKVKCIITKDLLSIN